MNQRNFNVGLFSRDNRISIDAADTLNAIGSASLAQPLLFDGCQFLASIFQCFAVKGLAHFGEHFTFFLFLGMMLHIIV